MVKIGVCIPTYQKPELVADVLCNELALYHNLGFALYVFDSSIDDNTKNIVEQYQEKFDDLFYFRFPDSMHSNEKVYRIFQMASDHIISCEYIWIRSDAMLCHKNFLRELVNYLDYDIIVTASQGIVKKGIRAVQNYQVFFEEYAWQLCLFGAVILNVNRMIRNADWLYLSSKYLVEQHINFSHVCFYFEQILKVKNCRILTIDLPEALYHGNKKKIFSTWYSDFFDLWLVRWPDTINCLPSYYKNKIKAIRLNGVCGKYNGIYNFLYLRHLAKDNIFTIEVFRKYRDRLRKYSGIDENYFKAIVGLVPLPDDEEYLTEEYNKLSEFVCKFPSIVIYGCGRRASRYVRYFIHKNIDFEKFIVTERERNVHSFMGHEVVSRDDYEFTGRTGVVLALHPEYQIEVMPFFKKHHMMDNLFVWPIQEYTYYFSFLEALKKHWITGYL